MSDLFETSLSSERWSSHERILFARASCLCFGISLLLWSLAPIVVTRVVSGETPDAFSLLLKGVTLLIAGAFIGFYSLIRDKMLWAIWAAFVLACIFLGAGLAASVANGFVASSSFVLFLSALTMVSTWLAIDAVTRERRELIAAVSNQSAPRDNSSA